MPFCGNSHTFMRITGAFIMGGSFTNSQSFHPQRVANWYVTCSLAVTTAINRACEMHSKRLATRLFGGNRVFVWLTGSIVYYAIILTLALTKTSTLYHSGIGF